MFLTPTHHVTELSFLLIFKGKTWKQNTLTKEKNSKLSADEACFKKQKFFHFFVVVCCYVCCLLPLLASHV